jgi:hypothetical protein
VLERVGYSPSVALSRDNDFLRGRKRGQTATRVKILPMLDGEERVMGNPKIEGSPRCTSPSERVGGQQSCCC